MTFNILDYTEKLENVEEKGSWLLADCPVCHAHKLKINASTGAYKCYANDCSSQKIRDSVAKYTPYIKTNLRAVRKAFNTNKFLSGRYRNRTCDLFHVKEAR